MNKKNKKNKRNKRIAILSGICILLILVIVLAFSGREEQCNLDCFAKCVANVSTMYTSTGCSACTYQLSLFEGSYKFLNIVNCRDNPQKCVNDYIENFPTWIIKDKKYGVMSLKEIAQLTGCELQKTI